jgi:glycosyltransferase involved in cell wall biosynthesis
MQRLGNLSMGLPDKLRVIQVLKCVSPDIVHVHSHSHYPFVYSKPLWPTVTTVHGLVFKETQYEHERMDSIRRCPRLLLESIIFRRLRHVIAVSSYVSAIVRERTRANIRIVENPVSTEFFRVQGQEVPGRILFVGTISRRKNLLDLLQGVAVVRRQLANTELRVVGAFTESSYAEEIRAFVAEHHLENAVTFLGHISEQELLREYAACQIVASVSHEESAGMIFQQAMAVGKAVVSARTSGIPDIVSDGKSGLLVGPGNPQALAGALELLLRNTELRYQMGMWGRKEANRRFRPEVVARRTYDVYQNLLSNN